MWLRINQAAHWLPSLTVCQTSLTICSCRPAGRPPVAAPGQMGRYYPWGVLSPQIFILHKSPIHQTHLRDTTRYHHHVSNGTRTPSIVCQGGHSMRTLYPHVSSKAHLDLVKSFDDQRQADYAQRQQFAQPRPQSPSPQMNNVNHAFDSTGDIALSDPHSPPLSPLSHLRALDFDPADPFDLGWGESGTNADDSDGGLNFEKLCAAFEALANDCNDEEEDERLDEECLEEDIAKVQVEDAEEWYPFKKVKHVVVLLIMGSTRNLLSRTQYQRICSILRILNVNLPEWGTLRAIVK
ncbi:uncharacterized protein MELLADRAFT_91284 [Melampsora larici-populina 98AG31]|uniref:Uncharacterized protein n=1 Tax=Melampsora larici-populina (strain 98AG31 / pathotype 3-4-7) TaxID=747676 RepID=F4RYH5_MELLP|nr:uncharacterized protein MELLADRAFT_91284 [Melampsora larici-populina 98AG31]EGG02576.1 hypothetical protein MELLADRAFT_91284 [Melampsora larici-populina 98AG31]